MKQAEEKTMQVSAEYPDGSDRLVAARERRIPIVGADAAQGPTEINVLEPIEDDRWIFVFQVERNMPNGGIFRAIPLLDADTFRFD